MKVLSFIGLAMIAALAATLAVPQASKAAKSSSRKPGAESVAKVEFFSAMKSGEISVKFIPQSSREANVIIKNKTNKPLSIQLPAAFAGVPKGAPVLAQFGGGGGMMGGGGGGGIFNIGAEKAGKIHVATFCLEHGKQDPDSRMDYEIRPIESFTANAAVIELCKMLGRGEVAQNAGQAAIWHLANGLTWEELAQKDRVRLLDGSGERYFTIDELHLAAKIAHEADRRGKENPVKYAKDKDQSLSKK